MRNTRNRGFLSILVAISAGCVILAPAPRAIADSVTLTDGKTIPGLIRETPEGLIIIESASGTFKFTPDQVARIDRSDTLAEFREVLKTTSRDDPASMLAAAEWAERHYLRKESQQLYSDVIRLQPDNSAARNALGHMKISGQWLAFDQCMALARKDLAAGSSEHLLAGLLPELERIAARRGGLREVLELRGRIQARAKDFTEAAKTFRHLSTISPRPESYKYAALADILEKSPDGMYVLKDSYPPGAALLGGKDKAVPPGPASLADPLILQAALWERAKADVNQGRKMLEQARDADPAAPDAARSALSAASDAFIRADALVPEIARNYRVEIVRMLIAIILRRADADAVMFDEMLAGAAGQDVSTGQYRDSVNRLIHHAENIIADMREIMEIAKPYSQELAIEVKLAELDLKKVESIRTILLEEINGAK